jgi:hypothetical protein
MCEQSLLTGMGLRFDREPHIEEARQQGVHAVLNAHGISAAQS